MNWLYSMLTCARRMAPRFGLVVHLVCLLLTPFICAHAHGPYDSSAQLLILSDSIEASATLGMDAAKEVLLKAGLSEADAAKALTVRGPSTLFDLSPDLAAHFVALTAGGKALKAQRLRVITDGLEASFIATYAGAYSGDLEVRARYFDGIEGIKPGVFVAIDEMRNVKGQAAFSRGKAEAVVNLGTPTTNVSATVKPETPVPSTEPVAPAKPQADQARSSSFTKSWLVAGVLIALVAGVIIFFRIVRHGR